jgi:hypothetical protein
MESLLTLAAGTVIRLFSLGIGTFFVYLGFRLFSQVPIGAEGDAEISGLKGTTIKLTRVGPGVFFALFGTVIVVWTLGQPMQHQRTVKLADGSEISEQAGAATAAPPSSDSDLHSRRALTRQDMEFLNQLGGALGEQQVAALRHSPDYVIPRIKRILMTQVWDDEAWGERAAFQNWLDRTGGLAQPGDPRMREALAFYQATPEVD